MARERLAAADDRRALASLEREKRRSRKYRCGTCGLPYSADELVPDVDDQGKRSGWICEHCY